MLYQALQSLREGTNAKSSPSRCSYLLRVLRAHKLSHCVERVCIRKRLGTHVESHHNLLAAQSHPGHHLRILYSDAGSGDLWHARLVPLPTSVWTRGGNNSYEPLQTQTLNTKY